MKKNRILLLLSFFMPAAIILIVLAVNGVSPFGDKNILFSDMGAQYYPFLSDYLQRIKGGHSLFWSWTQGGGIDYLAVFTYYLSSPLNLLLLLVPQSVLPEAVVFLIVIKIGLAGLFMGIFLMDCFAAKLRHTSAPGSAFNGDIIKGFATPLFATFYATSSFISIYYWNILWLDAFALLPLVILGEIALIREGKFRLYIIALSLSIITNFYMGFYTCVFVAITFFGQSFIQRLTFKEFLRKLALIAICSIIAIGITALLTLPAYTYLTNTGPASNYGFPDTITFDNYFRDTIGSFLAFAQMFGDFRMPNLYCGMLCVILIGPYLISVKIKLREKVIFIIFAVFMLFSFNINILDYMWNAFRYVNGLFFRYSYVLIFTITAMAYRGFNVMSEEIKRRDFLIILVIAFAVFWAGFSGIHAINVLPNAALVAGYLLIFAIMSTAYDLKNEKRKTVLKYAAMAAIIALALMETGVSAHRIMKGNIALSWGGYFDNYDETRRILAALENASPDSPSQQFYRTELTAQYSRSTHRQFNDPALFSYNGLSVYSSTIAEGMAKLYDAIGLTVVSTAAYSYNSYGYSFSSPIAAMFLNLRYLISDDENNLAENDIIWEKAGETGGGLTLLENKKYLPLGFLVSDDILNRAINDTNPFITQNNLFSAATGLNENLFTLLTPVNETLTGYTVNSSVGGVYDVSIISSSDFTGSLILDYAYPADGMLYVYADPGINIIISGKNDVPPREILNRFPYVIPVGYYNKDETVNLYLDMKVHRHAIGYIPLMSDKVSVFAAVINEELFNTGYDILADETLNLTEFKDTYIRGEITALADGLLYTSIPLSDNWTAYVDGVKTEIKPVFGAFAGVTLSEGDHIVEFRYFNKTFAVGVIISLISLGAFAVMWRRRCSNCSPQ